MNVCLSEFVWPNLTFTVSMDFTGSKHHWFPFLKILVVHSC